MSLVDAYFARQRADAEERDEAARRVIEMRNQRESRIKALHDIEDTIRHKEITAGLLMAEKAKDPAKEAEILSKLKELDKEKEELEREANPIRVELKPEEEHSTSEEEFELFEKYGCSTRAIFKATGTRVQPVKEEEEGRPHEVTLSLIPDTFTTEVMRKYANLATLNQFLVDLKKNPEAVSGTVSLEWKKGDAHIIAVEKKMKDGKPYLNWYEEPTKIDPKNISRYPKNKLHVFKGDIYVTRKHKIRDAEPGKALRVQDQEWFKRWYEENGEPRVAGWRNLTMITRNKEPKPPKTFGKGIRR